jgi:predicted ferric reductase
MGSVWWYVARSSGIVAWALAALSVLWGLLLSTKVLGRAARPNWLLDLHRFLGGLTVVFVGVHLLGLLFDPWIDFGPAQLLVPFASDWNPVAVAWGVVALYLLLAVEITSLVRNRIPRRWWRSVHFASYGVYVLGTVHLLTAGTDRHSPVLVWTVVITSVVVAAMTLYRAAIAAERDGAGTGRSGSTIRSSQPVG